MLKSQLSSFVNCLFMSANFIQLTQQILGSTSMCQGQLNVLRIVWWVQIFSPHGVCILIKRGRQWINTKVNTKHILSEGDKGYRKNKVKIIHRSGQGEMLSYCQDGRVTF